MTAPGPTGRTGSGWCPVCGACFGVAPVPDPAAGGYLPPSLLLEVAGALTERPLAWRLSVVGWPNLAQESANPRFEPADVRWRYVLCGNGHYFLDWIRLPGAQGAFEWRSQSFAATVGPVASGKSYLMVRTLNQPLNPSGRQARTTRRVERIDRTDPLEAVPKQTLEQHYEGTRERGVHTPMDPTLKWELMPSQILQDHVADEIPDAAVALQEQVVGRPRQPHDRWGTTVRQPILLRSRIDDRPVLTCVADLSGELFNWDARGHFEGVDTLHLLLWCNALVWVIDLFHAEGAFEELLSQSLDDEQAYEGAVLGSLRPGSIASAEDIGKVIGQRAKLQERIARQLTVNAGNMVAQVGGTMRNLVVVTKCDLLKLALAKMRLDELGEPGSVHEGTACYLEYLALDARIAAVSPAVERLLRYLRVDGTPDEDARRARVDQVADALAEYFSDSDAFWNLVHTGKAAEVPLRNDSRLAPLDEWSLSVPSIDEHLAACLRPGGSDQLQMRDVVMSALGCGVMYGLGHQGHVEELFAQTWRELQFFLCSPLGTVPMAVDRQRLRPSEGLNFPRPEARSAALTQLNLRILREALP